MAGDPPKTVADVMTRKVVTLFEDESLDLIEDGMARFRFRHVPIIQQDGTLVGLLTHHDLLKTAASTLEPDWESRTRQLRSRYRVSDVMVREVRTVRSTTTIVEAAQVMLDNKVSCLPVLNKEGKLVGIVTEADILTLTIRLLQPEAEQPAGPE